MSGSVTNLIRDAAGGDDLAKASLLRRYRRLLYDVAGNRLGTLQRRGDRDASDAVAEALPKILDNDVLAGIRDRRHFEAMVRTIVAGKAIDQIRYRTAASREPGRTEVLNARDHDRADTREVVELQLGWFRDLMEELPMDQYSAAVAYIECGGNRQVAAESLEIPVASFSVRLHRALDTLRRRYASAGEDSNS